MKGSFSLKKKEGSGETSLFISKKSGRKKVNVRNRKRVFKVNL